MGRKENLKRRYSVISAGLNLVTDQIASIAPELYKTMQYTKSEENYLIKAGTRINWNGTLKRAAVDLWDTEENNPENAPALWEDIMYKAGIRIIPETITAGTAFAKDERGWWNDKLYISLIDNNVWTPDTYSAGWILDEGGDVIG